ncbi:MAG: hypothetical protein WB764_20650 [Xanthobacteraceae bacterium]
MEFFLLRLFDRALQIGKMTDVAQQVGLVLFDMVLLHPRERIIAAIGTGQIKVGEVFQIR